MNCPRCTMLLQSGAMMCPNCQLELSQNSRSHPGSDQSQKFCKYCNTLVQSEWNLCPNCGESLRPSTPKSKVSASTNSIPQNVPSNNGSPITPIGLFGVLILIGGICCVIYYWQFFNVTVTTQPIDIMGQQVGGGQEVNNMGLMSDRQNGLTVGIGSTLLGAIMLVADAFLRRK